MYLQRFVRDATEILIENKMVLFIRYVPALKPLRQIALILNFPRIEQTTLAKRLLTVRMNNFSDLHLCLFISDLRTIEYPK